MNIVKTLKNIELIYGIFNFYRQKNNHRDFVINFHEAKFAKEYNLCLKGVIYHSYNSNIKNDGFKMDEKNIIKKQNEPIDGWHWGIEEFEILDYEIFENTDELLNYSKVYNNYKFYKLKFNISTAKLEFVFHDFEIEEIK
jgi:hypothetical protein